MENIELVKFSFNIDEVLKGATELKKAIDDLAKEQQELKKNGEANTKVYVENEAALKALRSEYGKHVKVLAESNKETADAVIRSQKLDVALNEEATTIKGLRDQNKILNELRNSANITTKEGQEELSKTERQAG